MKINAEAIVTVGELRHFLEPFDDNCDISIMAGDAAKVTGIIGDYSLVNGCKGHIVLFPASRKEEYHNILSSEAP